MSASKYNLSQRNITRKAQVSNKTVKTTLMTVINADTQQVQDCVCAVTEILKLEVMMLP
jgi:hypothetical protein